MKYGLGKRFFTAAILLKLCELLLFGERKKIEYTLVCISFLWIFKEEKTK